MKEDYAHRHKQIFLLGRNGLSRNAHKPTTDHRGDYSVIITYYYSRLHYYRVQVLPDPTPSAPTLVALRRAFESTPQGTMTEVIKHHQALLLQVRR